jgi:hypothetical protein
MNETTATVEKKSKKKKRPLTTAEKRAKTRRKNVVSKRAGSAGAAQKTALAKMEAIVSGLVALSDSELKSLKKVVDKQIQYRAAQQRIFNSIYKKA